MIITTFEMININTAPGEPTLGSLHWRTLVVDEAHRLKNAESKERVTSPPSFIPTSPLHSSDLIARSFDIPAFGRAAADDPQDLLL